MSITLIPKIPCPSYPGDYRPISCCHILYKCVAKLICYGLSKVPSSIVSLNQGAFVKGKNISHNILLCQDLVKHYSRKGCYPSCLIKVDIRKAYDTLDWLFVRDMMVALNFPSHFVKIIIACITSTQYA